MRQVGIDIETFSSVDITKSGAYAYAESPDFQILLLAYRGDEDDHTTVIDLHGMSREEAVWYLQIEYPTLYAALNDPAVKKTAFNAAFERTCLAQYFGEMPPEQWECTMIRCGMLGLPMSLEAAGAALGLSKEEAKLKTGKALIQYFCKPCKPTKANGGRTRNLAEHAPDKWALFIEYNARDVDAEQEILRRVNEYGAMDPAEHRLWCWDQRTNDHGVRLDLPYIEGILAYDEKHRAELTAEAVRLTGLANPNSVQQLQAWLSDQGVQMDGVTKETVAEALKRSDLSLKARRVLEIRQALGKTSTKKYQAMINAVCADSRLRGILQFYGANRTGRWAGRIVQTHNLPQNHLDDLDFCRELTAKRDFEAVELCYGETAFVFSQLVRTAFVADPGHTFVVCDFSAVEARILAWLSGEEWRQKVFAQGGDIYCMSASQMFHVPVEKHGVNSHLRQRGKVAELACIAEGQLVLTDQGEVPIEEVTKGMRLWDGEEWVSHEGVVCRGRKTVIEYDGLRATEDHIVWAEDEGLFRCVYFGDAAKSGQRLVQSGAGRTAIRLGEDHISGAPLSERLEPVLRADTMQGGAGRSDGPISQT